MAVKLCRFCGKQIPENSKICPYCNKALADKVFTFMNDSSSKNDASTQLDISKYVEDNSENSNNYFNTNLYSFSEKEIEKRFEKKPVAYDEERVINNENYRLHQEAPVQKPRVKKRKKQKNLLYPILCVIAGIVLLIVVISTFTGNKNDNDKETVQTSVSTSTSITTTTTTTIATTSTTTQSYISPSSVDLDGYLGISFSNVKDDFGEEIKPSSIDEFYGGNVYYYDGMTITTASNGTIVSMNVDYANVVNKDTYRYKKITYYSSYAHVIDELGEPELDQMQDATEPCIGYTLDIGSGLSIKFQFDDNNKVSGFNMFYVD
ncbi:MAG: zinc ribbon domain-containing protein [Clostridia bacterium]|nr:zinc ribbon domain-containing protein [Clostridia bacterium]